MSDVMIEAQGLGKRYGNTVALKSASFELRRGEILGFLGPNGAGKSTAMKILTCFIAPTTGTATVAGCDIWKDAMGVRRSIGYLPESNPLYKEMLVLEYLQWVASMRGLRGDTANKRILKVIEEVRLEEVVAKSINQLSKGYRQRVGLAQALLHEPPILILDEPMTGLDPNQARDIRKLIKDIGKERTIILSTHNLAEVAMTCTRVLIVDRGTIVADDTPAALAEAEARKYRIVYKRGEVLGEGGIRDSAGAASPASIFGSVPGIDQVRDVSKGENGEVEVEIVPAGDEDLRAELYKAAVKSGVVLLELSVFGRSLETVFQKLTTRDEVVLLREVGVAADEEEEEEEEDTSDEEEEEDTSEEEEEEDTSEEEEEEDTSEEEEEEEDTSSEEEEEDTSEEEEEEESASEDEDESSSSEEEEEEEAPPQKGKK